MEASYHGNFLYDTLIDMYVKKRFCWYIRCGRYQISEENLTLKILFARFEFFMVWQFIKKRVMNDVLLSLSISKNSGHAFAKSKEFISSHSE